MTPDIENEPALADFIDREGDTPKMIVDRTETRSVELRDPLEFEDELLTRITGPESLRGGTGASIPIKGRWIHGWLRNQGDDYINSIYKNWLHFTAYVKARTRQFINVSEYSIRQGSYHHMHRYIVILEKLGLVERTNMELVDPGEYDHYVPVEMRKRRFVTLKEPLEGNEDIWDRPHKTLYGGETDEIEEEEPEEEEPEPVNVPIETGPSGDSLDGFIPDEPEPPSISGDSEVPIANIDDFEKLQVFIENSFDFIAEEAVNETSIPVDIEPEDFKLDRVGVIGAWIEDDLNPGADEAEFVISVDGSKSSNKPGFYPLAIADEYTRVISEEFADVFESVVCIGTYSNIFGQTIRSSTSGDQRGTYYDLLNEQLVDVETEG